MRLSSRVVWRHLVRLVLVVWAAIAGGVSLVVTAETFDHYVRGSPNSGDAPTTVFESLTRSAFVSGFFNALFLPLTIGIAAAVAITVTVIDRRGRVRRLQG